MLIIESNILDITVSGYTITLLHQKAIWMPEIKTLIIADLHIGKIEHFRSAGIGLPSEASTATITKLKNILDTYLPEKVIFLGDLFHSRKNSSFSFFKNLLETYSHVEFILVSGNHDIMTENDYQNLGLVVVYEYYLEKLWLTHEPQDKIIPGFYNIAGHLHPGVRLTGKGKESISLSCFYFGEQSAILPAFGYFTGKAMLQNKEKGTIYAIADEKIIMIPKTQRCF